MKQEWKHNQLAEDLANNKGTPFLDLPLGSVFLQDCQRADVIEVKPSYTRFCVSIYEIKISRSDFQSDIRSGKWRGYLEHCHRFYFAVSQGVAQKCDIPPEAGLIVRGETGWSTVKAAPAREVQIPDHTLMSMIFMKERFAHSGQHRERLKQLLGYSSHRDHLLKSLGKKLGDALRNYDEYKQAKDNYEYWKEELLAAVNEGLGKTHGWPLSDLRDLVKRIKEKANAPVLPPVPIDPILAGMGRVIASAEQARNK